MQCGSSPPIASFLSPRDWWMAMTKQCTYNNSPEHHCGTKFLTCVRFWHEKHFSLYSTVTLSFIYNCFKRNSKNSASTTWDVESVPPMWYTHTNLELSLWIAIYIIILNIKYTCYNNHKTSNIELYFSNKLKKFCLSKNKIKNNHYPERGG